MKAPQKKPVITKDSTQGLVVKEFNEEQWRIRGVANRYNIKDLQKEVLLSGVFARSLSHRDVVPVFFGHDVNQPAGFAKLWETPDALEFDAQLERELDGGKKCYAYIKAAMAARYPAGISVGFVPTKDGITYIPDPGEGVYNPQNPPKSVDKVLAYAQAATKEISIAPFQANLGSYVTSAKQCNEYAELISKTEDDSDIIEPTEPKEPPVADNKTKDAASGLLTFEAALTQGKSEEPERLRIENALHAAMASILDSGLSKGEITVLVHKCQHCYADALSDWTAKSLDSREEMLGKVAAIKGMATSDHTEQQKRLAKAKVHLDESAAQRVSADTHANKAHKYMHEAIQAYSAADIQAPNGSASGANAKKSDEQEPTTKSDDIVLDLSALLGALTIK
jgi:hypothetical protein